jgi:hypothetical protein
MSVPSVSDALCVRRVRCSNRAACVACEDAVRSIAASFDAKSAGDRIVALSVEFVRDRSDRFVVTHAERMVSAKDLQAWRISKEAEARKTIGRFIQSVVRRRRLARRRRVEAGFAHFRASLIDAHDAPSAVADAVFHSGGRGSTTATSASAAAAAFQSRMRQRIQAALQAGPPKSTDTKPGQSLQRRALSGGVGPSVADPVEQFVKSAGASLLRKEQAVSQTRVLSASRTARRDPYLQRAASARVPRQDEPAGVLAGIIGRLSSSKRPEQRDDQWPACKVGVLPSPNSPFSVLPPCPSRSTTSSWALCG